MAIALTLGAPVLGGCPGQACPAAGLDDASAPGPALGADELPDPVIPPAPPSLSKAPAPSASILGDVRVEAVPLALLEARLPGPASGLPLDDALVGEAASPAERAGDRPAAVRDAAGGPDDHLDRGDIRTPHVEPIAREDPHATRAADLHARGHAVPDEARAAQAIGAALALALLALYHRLSKDRVLEHPTRERILALLAEEPGLGTTEVADALDVAYRTARHHLEKLACFGLVVAERGDQRCRWCLPEDAASLGEPLTDAQASVLALVENQAGLHLSEIARRLDMAKATAKFQLDRLTEHGFVEDEEVGPLRRFRATEAGRQRLSG